MRDLNEVLYDALHAGVVENVVTVDEAEQVMRTLDSLKLTPEEVTEIELIQLAVYEGNVHRRPEYDVRFLLDVIGRLGL